MSTNNRYLHMFAISLINLVATCELFSDELRQWTSISGSEVTAEYLSYSNGVVRLRGANGSLYGIDIDRLSKTDRNIVLKKSASHLTTTHTNTYSDAVNDALHASRKYDGGNHLIQPWVSSRSRSVVDQYEDLRPDSPYQAQYSPRYLIRVNDGSIPQRYDRDRIDSPYQPKYYQKYYSKYNEEPESED